MAAVLALDIVGYSRLMGLDEEGTHRRVIALLSDVVRVQVGAHNGRVVKTTGDGALAEFASVVDATRSALDILEKVPAANSDHPPDRRIELRIGINVGDVIFESDDIYGDGVNVAARLESLARPSSICVSDAVITQIADKFPFEFEDLGYQHLKNIQRPIRAFIILNRRGGIADADNVAVSSRPVPGFRGRPAIAVLPFTLSGPDPDGEGRYLVEGLADEIIQQLSAWRVFPVIARQSSFQFRDSQTSVKEIGSQLGADHLVLGTLRRAGIRLRVTARLVDPRTGHEILAQTADCAKEDLFDAQAELAQVILGALEPELLRVERERFARKEAPHPGSYDLLMRGLWHHYQYTSSHNAEARACFARAIELDPDNAQAHASMAISIANATQMKWFDGSELSYTAAHAAARRAVEVDGRDPLAHYALGFACMGLSRIPEAEAELDEAVKINPSYAAAYALSGFVKIYGGRPSEALQASMTALRLSPHDTRLSLWLPAVSAATFHLQRYDEAIAYGEKALTRRPGYSVPLRYVIAAHGWLGRPRDAKPLIEELRPSIASVEAVADLLRPYYRDVGLLEQLLEGLRRAGF